MSNIIEFRPRPQIPEEAHRAVRRAYRYVALAEALMAKADALADAAGAPKNKRSTPLKPKGVA